MKRFIKMLEDGRIIDVAKDTKHFVGLESVIESLEINGVIKTANFIESLE